MDPGGKTILVCGATGHQGGASARHLLEDGWTVRALTRHPDSPAAVALADLGAHIVEGDLMDRASLDRAAEGCYGVHSVETFREAGFEGEVAEGRNVADAAKAAGVRHFVYDSVIGAGEDDARAGWVRSKHEIERYVRETGLPWTILRPTTFMENLFRQRDDLAAGVLKGFEPPDAEHQYIAVDDIGRFAALAFRNPDMWLQTTTLIAGDRLPLREVAEVFGRVLGHSVRYEQVEPPPGTSIDAGMPEVADLDRLRGLLPGLKTLEEWARGVEWAAEPAAARA